MNSGKPSKGQNWGKWIFNMHSLPWIGPKRSKRFCFEAPSLSGSQLKATLGRVPRAWCETWGGGVGSGKEVVCLLISRVKLKGYVKIGEPEKHTWVFNPKGTPAQNLRSKGPRFL